jgi:molybdopterin molybdotransferase
MLAAVSPLPPVSVPLGEADGRWLAEPVRAMRDQPPFDASAMDGWAVRAATSRGAQLRIVGESAAGGQENLAVGPGKAVRIFTGAALPAGADHVVIQEQARRDGDEVVLEAVRGPARLCASAGRRFPRGQVLLEAGSEAQSVAAGAGGLGRTGRAGLRRPAARRHPAQRRRARRTGSRSPARTRSTTPGPRLWPPSSAVRGAWRKPCVPRGTTRRTSCPWSRVRPSTFWSPSAGPRSATTIGSSRRCGRWGRRSMSRAAPCGRASRSGSRPCPTGVRCWACRAIRPRPWSAPNCSSGPCWPCCRAAPARWASRPRSSPAPCRPTVRATTICAPGSRPAIDGTRRVKPFPNQDSSLVSVMAHADVLVRRPPLAPASPAGAIVEILRPDR